MGGATVAASGKPAMRGVLHHWAAVAAAGAGAVLVATAPHPRAVWAAAIYALSVVLLFGVSAAYHRPMWPLEKRALMRRLDHAAIFVLIAGTYTPICLLGLPPAAGSGLLTLVWSAAALGAVKAVFWSHAPRVVTAAVYLLAGWAVVPYLSEVRQALTATDLALLLGGGAVYSLGALMYATKRPEPVPGVFGHHEVFHALTVVACALHFSLVLRLVQASRA